MHKLAGLVSGMAITLAAGPALAQTFGTQGDAVFGVERLFGVHGTHVYEELDPEANDGSDEAKDTFIGLSLGWRGPVAPQFSPFDAPRLGFDYFVINNLSVGGSLGYASGSDDSEDFAPGGNSYATGPSDFSSFLIAPRAGYALMFADWVGFWPRAGVTFHTLSVSDVFSENGLAFTLEANFVIVPTPNIGVLIGPTLDLDLFGSRDYKDAFSQGNTVDRRYRTIGLQVGMFFWI